MYLEVCGYTTITAATSGNHTHTHTPVVELVFEFLHFTLQEVELGADAAADGRALQLLVTTSMYTES